MEPLWLALDLPRLPLEAHAVPFPPSAAVAHGRIVACDDDALAAGVAPGMGLAAARAVLPRLTSVTRDPARETAALRALACWAGTLTPRVALLEPCGLLLEIGACLRYGGGVANILRTAMQECADQGYSVRTAVAPTPQGAQWLALGAEGAWVVERRGLAAALDALSLSALGFPPRMQARFDSFGLHTLGDVRRMPSSALAARVGAEIMLRIGRAYGEALDPRRDFEFPERFIQALEFPAAVDSVSALMFASRRPIMALAGWLGARQAGIAACDLHLSHSRGDSTLIALRFAGVTRDARRIERVLRERLDRVSLPAPVTALRLVAATVESLPGESVALFEGSGKAHTEMAALVERLRARLGEARVHGITAVADHRPESATRRTAQGRNGDTLFNAPRPFWLLAEPEPLRERLGRPWRAGPLQLLVGPERIESGWWSTAENRGDLRRDYFVALTADARWAWIFRELGTPGGWFLHGWFA